MNQVPLGYLRSRGFIIMFFGKPKEKKEQIINEAFLENLKSQNKLNKIIKIATDELTKGAKDVFLYLYLFDAVEQASKNVDYKQLLGMCTQAVKDNPQSAALYKKKAQYEIALKQLPAAEVDLKLCLKLNPKDAESILELGKIRQQFYKFEDAIALYSAAIKLNPNYAEAYLCRYEVQFYKKNYNEALSDISIAMTMLAAKEDLLIKRGDLNFILEKYAEAIKDYTSALNQNIKNADVFAKRAKAYAAKKNYNYALADYEQILNIDKRNVSAMIESAKILNKFLNNPKAGMTMLESAQRIAPTDAIIYMEIAYAKADINDLDGAMADFEKAIKFSNNDPNTLAEICSRRGELFYKQGYYEEAIKDYNMMIEKNANNPNLFKKRANALKETGNYSAAAKDYLNIIKMLPDEIENYITLAYIYTDRLKNTQSGLKIIDTAIEKFGRKSVEIYEMKGEVLLKSGKFEEAVKNFDIVLEMDPENIDALYFKGNAEYKLGRLDDAIADYSSILQKDEQYYKAYNKRAFCYAQKKDYKKAIEDYSKAIVINPDLSSAIVNRAKCKEIIKDYHGALADYSTAITLNPKNLDVYYLRGNLKQLLGDSDGALADFSKTI